MQSISLTEAYKRVKNLKLPSAYNSAGQGTIKEDEKKLALKLNLIDKINIAEKVSGIQDLRDKIELHIVQCDYYNTANSNLYYKEKISKEDSEYIKDMFKYCKSELEYLEELLEEKLEVIEIEV